MAPENSWPTTYPEGYACAHEYEQQNSRITMIETSTQFLGFMAGFAIFGTGIALLAHRKLKAIGRVIDLTDPRQSQGVEYWRRIRGGGIFLLVLCSALLYAGINARLPDDLGAIPDDLRQPSGSEVEQTLE
ncbi:MAG TPA: hypothetical protein DFI00_10445 [Rhodospirillaceae bacterium]|nr:hypothetical protein [Alphaproteobacteria bacterium]OUT41903.1 MAG: hypothetical protein CBB62_06235 [Micavibrio sp. TMED2]HCI47702.1 hypothetical protein [Rhodospirillaceae bacterium]MAS46503.1 hypothetical protein [Alphaproteobacteria bacterium]MAX94597.1 hypothetical protein [Alphaproteobacteria bacterium]|tara:strand:+ start:8866 stop:9258 length:393 start_codon:yes stop_codon:yes gene_type:complete